MLNERSVSPEQCHGHWSDIQLMKNKQTKEMNSRDSLKAKPNTSVDGECGGFLAELPCHDDKIHLKKRKEGNSPGASCLKLCVSKEEIDSYFNFASVSHLSHRGLQTHKCKSLITKNEDRVFFLVWLVEIND